MQKKIGSQKKNYGLIITAIFTLLDFIGEQIKSSVILSFFHNYNKFEEKFDKSVLAQKLSYTSKLKPSFLKFKLKFAAYSEKSILLDVFEYLGSRFFSMSLKSFGVFLLTYGSFLVSVNFGTHMETLAKMNFSDTFIFGCILIVVSFFMLPVKRKNISSCLYDSKILSYFLVDVFSVKHINRTETSEVLPTSGMSIVFGLIFGALSYFISPVFMAFITVLVFVLYLILTKPENGILLICLTFPFMSDKVLSFVIITTALSTLFKILRGKRALHFNICSGAIMLLAVISYSARFGSFDTAGAVSDSMDIILAAILALTVITVINSSALSVKCFRMLEVSTVITSLYGIGLFLVTCLKYSDFSDVLTELYRIGMTSSFTHSDFFAAFLICLIPVFFVKHDGSSKLLSMAALALSVLCLVMTNTYYAVLSLIIALILSVIVFSKFGLWVAAVATGFIYLIKYLLPNVAPLSLAKYLDAVNNTESSIMFKYNAGLSDYVTRFWFCGSGSGSDSAALASASTGNSIAYYSGFGETYVNIIMKIGIPLFIVALLLIFVLISRIFTYSLDKRKSPAAKSITASVVCSASALIIYAFFTNLIIDYRIAVMILLVLSLGIATSDSADDDYIEPGTVRETMYTD